MTRTAARLTPDFWGQMPQIPRFALNFRALARYTPDPSEGKIHAA
ncbi:MAG: hypothetical protein P3W90_003310 [Paracoccus sp. (in: a-proteobacteria)]|nr:hypothetical protein [Paracoccus sp. (in: a-proteobacteria)]